MWTGEPGMFQFRQNDRDALWISVLLVLKTWVMKWAISIQVSLFQGYPACWNGGHWSGPGLVPSTQPSSCRRVWTHRAVRHRGAVYHVCSCSPPHEYPLASEFPVFTSPVRKKMARSITCLFSFHCLIFFSVLRIETRLLLVLSVCSIKELYSSPAFSFLMCGNSYGTHWKVQPETKDFYTDNLKTIEPIRYRKQCLEPT